MSFNKIEGDSAIVMSGGVYQECDLYEWDGMLFAQWGRGFVRLNSNGSTSKSSVQFQLLKRNDPLYADPFGRLAIRQGGAKWRTLQAQPDGKLLELAAPTKEEKP